MDSDAVKQLLEKHFGKMHMSLTVDNQAKSNSFYYYKFDAEEDITALTNLFALRKIVCGTDKFPELKQSFGDKNKELPQCAFFRWKNGKWYIDIMGLTGVRYHRSFGKHVVATLEHERHSSLTLTDNDELNFYGYWAKIKNYKNAPYMNSDGFSYWMNKQLQRNPKFRAFTVEFFFYEAELSRFYILKDVARTIEKFGCFLIPISFADLLEYRTPAELIARFENDDTDLNLDFNKIDLNLGYIMIILTRTVDKRDWKLIRKLDVDTVKEIITLKHFYEGFSVTEFIKKYYFYKFGAKGYDAEMYAYDYAEMCLQTGQRIRMGFSSEHALIEAHDEMMRDVRIKTDAEEMRRPLVITDSRFDYLETKIEEVGNGEFERIKTTQRLFEEGEEQHNCVFSRREKIRNDSAAVFHWNHNGKSYTVQFSAYENDKYTVDEIRAKYNQYVTDWDLEYLKKILKEFCIVGDNLKIPFYLGF